MITPPVGINLFVVPEGASVPGIDQSHGEKVGAGDVAGVGAEGDQASEEIACIKPADTLDTDEAVGVDMADGEADLVHMGSDHDLERFGGLGA